MFVSVLLVIMLAMEASAIKTLSYAVSPPPGLGTSLFWTLIALSVALIVLIIALGDNSNNPI